MRLKLLGFSGIAAISISIFPISVSTLNLLEPVFAQAKPSPNIRLEQIVGEYKVILTPKSMADAAKEGVRAAKEGVRSVTSKWVIRSNGTFEAYLKAVSTKDEIEEIKTSGRIEIRNGKVITQVETINGKKPDKAPPPQSYTLSADGNELQADGQPTKLVKYSTSISPNSQTTGNLITEDDVLRLYKQGQQLTEAKQNEKAIEYLSQSLAAFRKIGNTKVEPMNLFLIGMNYIFLGDFPKGREFLRQSVEMAKKIGDKEIELRATDLLNKFGEPKAEAFLLFDQGQQMMKAKQYQKAIDYFQKSLTIFKKIKDTELESKILFLIGGNYLYLGDISNAREFLLQSVEIAKKIGDKKTEEQVVELLNKIGEPKRAEALWLLNQGKQLAVDKQYQKAIDYFQKSLTIFKEIKDTKFESSLLLGIGVNYLNLRDVPKGRAFLLQALDIARKIGFKEVESGATELLNKIDQQSLSSTGQNRKNEAEQLIQQGIKLYQASRYREAIPVLEAALEIYQEIKDRANEAASLNNLGSSYSSLFEHQKAIDFYQRSLIITKQIGDRNGEAVSLGNLAAAHSRIGERQKAIDFYQQALAIFKQIGDRKGEAMSLNDLGEIYRSLGQYQKAIDFYQQSLVITKQIGDRNGEARAFNNLGATYDSLAQYQKAIDFYQQALAIFKQIGNRKGEASSLSNLGSAYQNLREDQKVIDYYLPSLAIFKQIGDRNGEAVSLGNLGSAYIRLGRYEGIALLQQSLAISKQIGLRNTEASSLKSLGGAFLNLRQYQKAIDFYQQSLAIFKQIGVREDEAATINSLGVAFDSLKQPEISILFFKQAVNILEAIRKDIKGLKKEEQQSYIISISAAYRNLALLLIRQDRIMEALQVLDLLKVQELEDYLKNIKGSDRSAQGIRLLAPELALSDKLLAVSFDNAPSLNQQLANQFQQLPKSEINKVPDYLNQIPQGTVLLYPFILGDRLEIILFSPNSLPINRIVKISKDQLQTLVTEFRAGLQNNGSTDVKEPAAKLYDLLIKPIESELLQFKADTILYAPDGQLRYVPLAALYDGKQWLIEKYRISNLIAYTLTDFTASPKTQPSILAGAYGNVNHKTSEATLSPLPATIKEVQAIANSFTNSVTFIEDKFSRPAIESQLKNYNILHLATHAEFNTGVPDNSFIIFGNGDKIRLNEITDWQIPNINLIILSACQTGLGKLGEGVEILGFGYQVQKAGAKNAIASLWKVDDAGTQALMEAFYGELKKGDVTITEALRRAQIAMINSDKKGTGSDRAGIRIVGTVPSSSTLSHPYYWSAFFAIGNGL